MEKHEVVQTMLNLTCTVFIGALTVIVAQKQLTLEDEARKSAAAKEANERNAREVEEASKWFRVQEPAESYDSLRTALRQFMGGDDGAREPK